MELNIFSYKLDPLPQGFVFGRAASPSTQLCRPGVSPPLTSCAHRAKSCWFYLLPLLSVFTAFSLVQVTFISCINYCDNLSLGLSAIPLPLPFNPFSTKLINNFFLKCKSDDITLSKALPCYVLSPACSSAWDPACLTAVSLFHSPHHPRALSPSSYGIPCLFLSLGLSTSAFLHRTLFPSPSL